MFETIRNAWKIVDLRKKLIYTFVLLVIFRLGSYIPVPFLDPAQMQALFSTENSMFGFMDVISGGAFSQATIFAMSISPYINSSIIMQLLCVAIPALERLQQEGEEGRKKIGQLMRYGTVVLALIQAVGLYFLLDSFNAITNPGWASGVVIVTTFTAGTAFLMWLGEQITEKGVGNGISIVLVINIISRMPQEISGLFEQFVIGKKVAIAVVAAVIIIAVIVGMTVLVVILNGGVRKIPVQYAKKVQGRKMVGGQTTNIPLKVNTAGVIPIIFASSIMQLPIIISSFAKYSGTGVWAEILKVLNSGYWCKFKAGQWYYSIGLLVYVVLVVFFAYFYTSITFNPLEISENMKKQGGFIPGIRPGKPTSDYLTKVLNYIIFIGAAGLTVVGVLPFFFNGIFNTSVTFGGTSLIIVVSVVLETMKQIESQMLVRNYKGFLND